MGHPEEVRENGHLRELMMIMSWKVTLEAGAKLVVAVRVVNLRLPGVVVVRDRATVAEAPVARGDAETHHMHNMLHDSTCFMVFPYHDVSW